MNEQIKGTVAAIVKRIDLWDLVALAGAGFLVLGLWDLYPPARWIVIGATLVVAGIRRG